jgi:hypothetical protein
LSFSETEELIKTAENASHRHDFHMANRIRRFIGGSGPRSRWTTEADLPDLDDEDQADEALSELLAIGLEDTPPDMVKRMIAKLGRHRAVMALDERIRTSPLGAMLPEKMLRELAKGIVDSIIATGGRSLHE